MFRKIKQANSGAQTILALITLVAGFAMMWGSSGEESNGRTARRIVNKNATDIDTAVPDPSNNRKLVVASGSFSSTETLGDEYLKAGPYLILNRKAEMYQWTEKTSPYTGLPEYQLAWVDGPVDFLKFSQPTGHENPLFKIQAKEQRVMASVFGGFSGDRLLSLITVVPDLELTQDLLADPSLEIQENKIVLRRDPTLGGTMLGDVRISYKALPADDYTVMTVQQNEVSLVGAAVEGPLVIRRGRFSSDELLGNLEEESQRTYANLLYLGGAIFFFGLSSLLAKFAPGLDLSPKIQLRGLPAILFVSGGASIVTMLLFLVLSFVG